MSQLLSSYRKESAPAITIGIASVRTPTSYACSNLVSSRLASIILCPHGMDHPDGPRGKVWARTSYVCRLFLPVYALSTLWALSRMPRRVVPKEGFG